MVVALSGIHALPAYRIRSLLLEEVDLPGRRLDPEDLDRPLDEYTAEAITDYLAYRCRRWPNSTNPHLLISRNTATTTAAVGTFWMDKLVKKLPVSVDRLRQDRILEEALANGADPFTSRTSSPSVPKPASVTRPPSPSRPPNRIHAPPERQCSDRPSSQGNPWVRPEHPSEFVNSRGIGVDAFYCRPGEDGAHEKGGVEHEGGWFRRTHLVPVPEVATLEELNAKIAEIDATGGRAGFGLLRKRVLLS